MKIRKVIAFLLSLVMAAGLISQGSVAAFADGSNTFESVSVTVASDFTLHVTAAVEETVTQPTVRFAGAGKDEVVPGVKKNGKWHFDFSGIYSQCLADTINMELLDGTTVLASRQYSIKEYFNTLYGSTAAELHMTAEQFAALKLLLADALEFGAKAQAYAQYNTANPANALAWVAETKTQSFTAPETDFVAVRNGLTGDRIAAASLKISNFAQIRVSVEATKADRLVVSNDSGASLIYMLADSEKDGDVYTVFCGGLPATEYDTVWTAALADAEGTTYAAVKYSVNSYVAAKCGSDDALLAELVKAMYNYGVSADNYITVKAAADAVTDGGLTGEEEGNGESGSYNDLFG